MRKRSLFKRGKGKHFLFVKGSFEALYLLSGTGGGDVAIRSGHGSSGVAGNVDVSVEGCALVLWRLCGGESDRERLHGMNKST